MSEQFEPADLSRIIEMAWEDRTPFEAIEAYRPYMAARLGEGVGLHAMTRHMLGLFNGQPGARLWRRTLSERAPRAGAGLDDLDAALEAVRSRIPA